MNGRTNQSVDTAFFMVSSWVDSEPEQSNFSSRQKKPAGVIDADTGSGSRRAQKVRQRAI
jgi:hypothetical protein